MTHGADHPVSMFTESSRCTINTNYGLSLSFGWGITPGIRRTERVQPGLSIFEVHATVPQSSAPTRITGAPPDEI